MYMCIYIYIYIYIHMYTHTFIQAQVCPAPDGGEAAWALWPPA